MTRSSFIAEATWPDTQGNHINAHGGGILYHEGMYYWFGEARPPRHERSVPCFGVSCYVSSDLYNWRSAGIVLPLVRNDPQHDLRPGCIIERPKVLFNSLTGRFVMWFHLELAGQGYRAARSGVAVSDSITGPFRFIESFRPDGEMARDMTLFQDDDGQAYLFAASEENQTIHMSLLSDDYTKPSGRFARFFERRYMEAPAVFKHEGRYYFIGSDCTGWKPNPMRSAVADSIWGPWTELGNPCVGPNANLSFGSQSTFVLPVPGKRGAFIYMGDQWRPENPIDGRHLWLPIQFSKDRPIVRFRDRWDLSFFDSPQLHALAQEHVAEQHWAPARSLEDRSSRSRDFSWFPGAKTGLLINWGLQSVSGEPPAPGEPLNEEYARRVERFAGEEIDVRSWIHHARAIRAAYVMLTAKHADGFCLWRSAWSEGGFTMARTKFAGDLLDRFTTAARDASLRVGLEYWPVDRRMRGAFDVEHNRRSALIMKAQGYGQVRELASLYGPLDLICFGNAWLDDPSHDSVAFWEPHELNRAIREWQPSAGIGGLPSADDFDVPSTESISDLVRTRPWQGRVPVHSAAQVICEISSVITRNGNALLVVEPDASGNIRPEQTAVLNEVGGWLAACGEAVFDTSPGPFAPAEGLFGSTARGNAIYLHMSRDASTPLRLPPISQSVVSAAVVGADAARVRFAQNGQGLEITVPEPLRRRPVVIVKLELNADLG